MAVESALRKDVLVYKFKKGDRVESYMGYMGTFVKYICGEECDCIVIRDDMKDKEYRCFSWMLYKIQQEIKDEDKT